MDDKRVKQEVKMDTSPYEKNQLYTGVYSLTGGVVRLPDDCKWLVLHYQGFGKDKYGHFISGESGPITLCLGDNKNSFWPVISFLTDEEARTLAEELMKAVGNNKGGEQ